MQVTGRESSILSYATDFPYELHGPDAERLLGNLGPEARKLAEQIVGLKDHGHPFDVIAARLREHPAKEVKSKIQHARSYWRPDSERFIARHEKVLAAYQQWGKASTTEEILAAIPVVKAAIFLPTL